jgi:site-specific recombinase XerD
MEQMETFLTKLAVEAAVSASTQKQSLSAVQFLFRVVGIEMDSRIDAVRAKPSRRLPVVLSTGEVTCLSEAMEGTYCDVWLCSFMELLWKRIARAGILSAAHQRCGLLARSGSRGGGKGG